MEVIFVRSGDSRSRLRRPRLVLGLSLTLSSALAMAAGVVGESRAETQIAQGDANRFGLTCAMTDKLSKKNYEFKMNVDLQRRHFTIADEQSPRPIHAITDTTITFEYFKGPVNTIDRRLDRYTGYYSSKYTMYNASQTVVVEDDGGTCRKVAYAGPGERKI